MGHESLYLLRRASFHRRMARQAACGEARCAHEAFVRAYRQRIEEAKDAGRPAAFGFAPAAADAHRPVPSLAAAE